MKKKECFEHNKFIYTEQGIEYPKEKKLPHSLFKYYAFSKYSVDAFLNNYLYFSHPSQLNDIVDSTDLLLDFKDCSEENYNGLYKFRIKVTDFNKNQIPSYEDAKKNDFLDLRIFTYFYTLFNKGLLSLTTHPFNKLMMAHYTSETGFVLEFEPNTLLDSLKKENEYESIQLFPMNYSEAIEPINFFEKSKKTVLQENGQKTHSLNYKIPMLYIASLKDEVWDYEDEWRILIDKEKMGHFASPLDFREIPEKNKIIKGRQIKYNYSCLNKIILAPMFFNNSSFKTEFFDLHNNKIHYTLNVEFFQKEGLLDSVRKFLNKICSDEFIGKVFIQYIDFANLKYERKMKEILNLVILNDVISFSYGKVYSFENTSKNSNQKPFFNGS